jgi:hypothetical protein
VRKKPSGKSFRSIAREYSTIKNARKLIYNRDYPYFENIANFQTQKVFRDGIHRQILEVWKFGKAPDLQD